MHTETIAALLIAFFLAGCATSPTPSISTEPGTPLSRTLTTPSQGTGRIIVKRDGGFMGMGCTHRIYLDGVPAADLRSGQAVTLYADPGEHVLSAIATALCDGSSEISMAILTGQTKTFRSGADGNGNIRLQPTAF